MRQLHKDTHMDWDAIPVERHWSISMRLHKALGHSEPWEICQDGCDILAAEVICDLFDQEPPKVDYINV